MTISIDVCELDRAIVVMGESVKRFSSRSIITEKEVHGDFTEEPGLRELGQQHAQVITGDVGSAIQTLKQLRRLVRWLAEGTKAMRGAFVGQDGASAAALCGAQSLLEPADFTFPAAPQGGFDAFEFRNPYQGGEDDPEAILAMLNAGDDGHIHDLADYWKSLASSLNDMVDQLSRARRHLEMNTGEAIDGAAESCLRVMSTASTFADNATAMHMSVAQLPHIRASARRMVQMIHDDQTTVLAAAANPQDDHRIREKARAETREYMQGMYQQMLDSAVPSLRNLTDKPPMGRGGRELNVTAPAPVQDVGAAPVVATPMNAVAAPMRSASGVISESPNGVSPVDSLSGDSHPHTPPVSAPTVAATTPTTIASGAAPIPGSAPASISGLRSEVGEPSRPVASSGAPGPGGHTPRVWLPSTWDPSFGTGADSRGPDAHRSPGGSSGPGGRHRAPSVGGRDGGREYRAMPPSGGRARGVPIPIDADYRGNGSGGGLHQDRGVPVERGGGHGEQVSSRHKAMGTPGQYGPEGTMGRSAAPMGYGSSGGGKGQKGKREGKYRPTIGTFETEYNLRQLRGDITLTTPRVIGKELREHQ